MRPKYYPYSGKKRLPKIVSADKATEIVLSAIDSCVFQRQIFKEEIWNYSFGVLSQLC